MKRILLFLCLFTISFNLVASSENDAREFITGFFQAIKGNDWKLNPECFGPATKEKFGEFFSALLAADWTKAYVLFYELLGNEAKNECPLGDFLDFKNRLETEIAEGKIFNDIKTNSAQIMRILGETIYSPVKKTPYTYGKAFGSIAALVLYQKQPQKALTFLALPELASNSEVFLGLSDLKLTREDFDKFFRGLLTGVSVVPYDQNKCYKEVAGSLDEISSAAMKVYNAVVTKNASDFTAAVAQLTVSLLKIKAYDQNCNVTQLIKSISVYSASYVGLAKLFYNIASHGLQYFELSKEIYKAVGEKNFENGGVAAGKIVKTLLSWETK